MAEEVKASDRDSDVPATSQPHSSLVSETGGSGFQSAPLPSAPMPGSHPSASQLPQSVSSVPSEAPVIAPTTTHPLASSTASTPGKPALSASSIPRAPLPGKRSLRNLRFDPSLPATLSPCYFFLIDFHDMLRSPILPDEAPDEQRILLVQACLDSLNHKSLYPRAMVAVSAAEFNQENPHYKWLQEWYAQGLLVLPDLVLSSTEASLIQFAQYAGVLLLSNRDWMSTFKHEVDSATNRWFQRNVLKYMFSGGKQEGYIFTLLKHHDLHHFLEDTGSVMPGMPEATTKTKSLLIDGRVLRDHPPRDKGQGCGNSFRAQFDTRDRVVAVVPFPDLLRCAVRSSQLRHLVGEGYIAGPSRMIGTEKDGIIDLMKFASDRGNVLVSSSPEFLKMDELLAEPGVTEDMLRDNVKLLRAVTVDEHEKLILLPVL